MPHVLITGANGFIGRALCAEMLAEGWKVRGSVRSRRGFMTAPKGLEIMETGSIGPRTDWSKLLKGVDTVVHLAAQIHRKDKRYAGSLDTFRSVNVMGSERLAGMAESAGVRRFVYMSSAKVNGEGTSAPYKGKDRPEPQGPYAISKWEAEQRVRHLGLQTGLEVVILRPPVVYGPGVGAHFLRLFWIVRTGIPLPFAGIQNLRSFIYQGNLLHAVRTCIARPQAAGRTYMVSDGEDVSTPELIKRSAFALGTRPRLFPFPPVLLRALCRPLGLGSVAERLLGSLTVDSSKIRRELAWSPPYTLDEGLQATARWYKQGDRK
jgi:nucleoside-diphosphate-sugar epimerase